MPKVSSLNTVDRGCERSVLLRANKAEISKLILHILEISVLSPKSSLKNKPNNPRVVF